MLSFTPCFTSPLLSGRHLIKDERLALKRRLVSVQKLEPRVPQRPAQKNAENHERHQLHQKKREKNEKKVSAQKLEHACPGQPLKKMPKITNATNTFPPPANPKPPFLVFNEESR